jgi:acetyltransferase-like isoleucine patch superfamily enzyme
MNTSRLTAAFQAGRIRAYRALWTCPNVSGSPVIRQPVVFYGPGTIVVGKDVEFGWHLSMGFYSGYSHVEAAAPSASIVFGDGAEINNSAMIKSEGAGISIGARALLGSQVVIYDSDFHELDPARRREGTPKMAPVELGENVFIGDRVMILKGSTIGADSVIGAGSVVVGPIPSGVIAAGNPARVVRDLGEIRKENAEVGSPNARS